MCHIHLGANKASLMHAEEVSQYHIFLTVQIRRAPASHRQCTCSACSQSPAGQLWLSAAYTLTTKGQRLMWPSVWNTVFIHCWYDGSHAIISAVSLTDCSVSWTASRTAFWSDSTQACMMMVITMIMMRFKGEIMPCADAELEVDKLSRNSTHSHMVTALLADKQLICVQSIHPILKGSNHILTK